MVQMVSGCRNFVNSLDIGKERNNAFFGTATGTNPTTRYSVEPRITFLSHSERYYDIAAINKYFVDILNDLTSVEHFSLTAKKKLTETPGLWGTD